MGNPESIPEVRNSLASALGERAEALRATVTSAQVPTSAQEQIRRFVDDTAQAVVDLEARLTDAENTLVECRQRLAQEIEHQEALRSRLTRQGPLASVGALTAGIAHEVRNPLNFVNNFAAVLVDLVDDLDKALKPVLPALQDDAAEDVEDLVSTIGETAEKIRSNGRSATRVIATMLEHSRGVQPGFRPTDLNSLVEEFFRLSCQSVRAKNPDFNFVCSADLQPDLGPVEIANHDISRVLLNIFSNAFDAVRERTDQQLPDYQPRLAIATRSTDDDHVEIVVSDNGVGIDSELLPKVTAPFVSTKQPGLGTGLGLGICKDIVETRHHGRLTIESEPGAGTSVRILLPKSQPGAPATSG